MYRIFVVSSELESVGYDQVSQIMEIEYRDGSIIQFINVPWELNREFMISSDRDSYYKTNIEGKFDSKRINQD